MFLFKKKKIVLDAFTNRLEIYDSAKPKEAKLFYPEWWKSMPKSLLLPNNIHPLPSMKTCQGLIDQFKFGFIVPMWSDLNIEIGQIGNPEARWIYSDNFSEAVPHSELQRGSFLPDNIFFHLKLVNPWLFYCKENIQFQLTPASWHIKNPHEKIIPSGILNFKYQNSLNINAFFTRTESKRIENIKFGEPLLHLVQLSDRELIIKHHLVEEKEWIKFSSFSRSLSFTKKYSMQKKNKSEKSCPFHQLTK